jgi:hypothetical protein
LRKMHYWSGENPHWLRQVDQWWWRVNVWCGIIGDCIIGLYFIEGLLIGCRYTAFLSETLLLLLEDLLLQTRLTVWFQHDGCPAHNAHIARQILHGQFSDLWIGCSGPVRWPPHSAGLTPLHFFLWGTIKDKVYK